MQSYQDNLLGQISGVLAPLKGVSVTVTSDATGLRAVLYSDNGVTAQPQPLVTDGQGFFSFYVADGSYTLAFSGPGIVALTRRISLDDPNDNPYVTLAQVAAPSFAGTAGYTRGSDGAVMTMANALDAAAGQSETTVRNAPLTGLSLATNAAITAADTVLGAFGKLQKQFTAWLAAKDANGGYVGLSGFRINFKNTAGTVNSLLENFNSALRTYTFPDKDGTVAMISDIPTPLAYFQSPDQTIATAGTVTFAHGFAAAPKLMECFIKCITAEAGYSVGDILSISVSSGVVSSGQGASVTFDATNFYIRYGNAAGQAFAGNNKATGVSANFNNANWKFFIRALS